MIDWDKETLIWTKEVPFTKENIKTFDKNGVYRLINEENEIVYIGSAYKRLLKERLRDYFNHYEDGCSLRSRLRKKGYSHERIDGFFDNLKVSVCEYKDLEMYLIKKYHPKCNKSGKNK